MAFSPTLLKHKFIFTVLCLVVALLCFLTANWLEKVETSRQTEYMEDFSSLVVAAGATVHELQKERTLSAGFLASNGAKFSAELAKQKQLGAAKTDLLVKLLEMLNERLFHGNLPEHLKKTIPQIINLLGDMQQLQSDVETQKISVKEALDQYSATGSIILDFLVDLVQTKQAHHIRNNMPITIAWLVGWLCVSIGLLIAGFVARDISRGAGFASRIDTPLGQKTLDGYDTARMSRMVGLHAGSITACASELIAVRDLIRADASTSHTIAKNVAGDTSLLGSEISAVKQAIEMASDNIMAISAASQQLSANIGAIATASEQASNNISTVASAAEEITANISGVNQSLSHVDKSLQEVTQATQGMTGSLEEVRKRCLLASRESDRVNQHALGSSSIMTELSDSAREIGDVVEIINSIAEQTNMLALNASIEAAGAGDAGKGFAVVANEVKELARQTGKATQLIAQKADNIQQKTDMAAEANTEITKGIGLINQGNAEITLAVDEQAATIQGIAKTMNSVAEATAEVTRNAQELNVAAQDVAKAALEAATSTTAIARSAAEGADGSVEVAEGSSEALTLATTILKSAENTELASSRVQEQMAEAAHTAALMHGSATYLHHMGTILQRMTNALYVSQIEMETGVAPFNIRMLKNHILHWQGVLEQRIHGRHGLEENPIPAEAVCPVCQWFMQQEQGRLGVESAFKEALKIHKTFHEIAQGVMTQLATVDLDGAQEQLKQYYPAREAFFKNLDILYLGEEICQQEAQLFFPWDDKLNIGVQEIDDDHKQLVSLVNQLHRTMKEGGDAATLDAILKEAAEYTHLHFSREEQLMRRHNYPGLVAQEAEHKLMVEQLLALAVRFKEGEFPVSMDIMAFARTWLTKHILGTDMKLKTFFADKQI